MRQGGALALLLGAHGREFVAHALSTHGPAEGIEAVQQRGALRDPDCEPLLGLLEFMGSSRAEARRAGCVRRAGARVELTAGARQVYHAMLGAALGMLRDRIPRMSQGTLLKLLEVRRRGASRARATRRH